MGSPGRPRAVPGETRASRARGGKREAREGDPVRGAVWDDRLLSGNGEHVQALEKLVDVGEEGGVVPAGVGGDPPSQQGELGRLGEVLRGEPMGTELASKSGPEVPALIKAALETGSTLKDLRHPAQVDRDGSTMAVARVRLVPPRTEDPPP